MKILFVNQNMKMGGIANSLYNLILELKNSKHDIELLLFDPYVDDKFIDLQKDIKINTVFPLGFLYINLKTGWVNLTFVNFIKLIFYKTTAFVFGKNKLRLKLIKKTFIIKNYDVSISFSNDIPINNTLVGCNDFVLKSVKSKNTIAWIHNDLDRLGMNEDYLTTTYLDFDKIVNVSLFCKKRFETLVPKYTNKSYLVHNYIDFTKINKKALEFLPFTKKTITFVTVARIANNQKRIDRIIKIVKRLKENNHNFKWYVVGDGPDRKTLTKEVIQNNLESHLVFLGFKKNPYPYIKNADCFVLTSKYEAQGMVLSEALALKTPIITTNFPAAFEFVQDTVFGKIVDNTTQGLFDALEDVLVNPKQLLFYKNEIQNKYSKLDNSSLYEFENLIY